MSHMEAAKLAERFIDEGIPGIQSDLDNCPADGDHRLVLLNSVRKAVDAIYIEDMLLDRMHEIYDACIDEAIAIANGDEELISYANFTSYNLAANLADCWADAEETRSTQHFSAGVEAAKRCLDLRIQLKKPPAAMAMAYFILGVHEYSLQNFIEAERAWVNKLEHELLDQKSQSEKEESLNIILSGGLIGLARWSLGAEDNSNYEDSFSHLEAKRTTENSGEIDLFLDELKLLKQRHGP